MSASVLRYRGPASHDAKRNELREDNAYCSPDKKQCDSSAMWEATPRGEPNSQETSPSSADTKLFTPSPVPSDEHESPGHGHKEKVAESRWQSLEFGSASPRKALDYNSDPNLPSTPQQLFASSVDMDPHERCEPLDASE